VTEVNHVVLKMFGEFAPVHPCRRMSSRHCPVVYEDVCGDRPCARFESDDETPWLAEIGARAVIVDRED
jgi:hypothetical protein